MREKQRGRELVQQAAATVARNGADVVVRINRPWRQGLRDIEAAISPAVQALMLTKVESADHVRMIAEIVDELEAERGMIPGTTKFVALIETAGAFFRMPEIARAHPRLIGLSVGAEDFALASLYIGGLASGWSDGLQQAGPFMVALIALGLAGQFTPDVLFDRAATVFARVPSWGLGAVAGIVVALVNALGPEGVAPFIYFRF